MKKITTKKLMIALSLVLFGSIAYAQGLEHVTVEKYYVSNANDANGSVGNLPSGSVTWRIFVDMAQGYKFKALFGTQDNSVPPVPLHTLSISTTTTFFNNEDRGATTPTINTVYYNDNSVAIDSWFSVGAAANGQMGVLKTEDNNGINFITAPPADPMLQNNDITAAPPLTAKDGMVAGSPETVTFVGLDLNTGNHFLDPIDATSQVGGSMVTSNGSIASLNGSVGPDAATNKVLVGQFTTDGVFCFQLNILLATPTGGSEYYVAMNATGSEILFPELIFCSSAFAVNESTTPASSVSVYPNPANDFITIAISSSDKINSNSYRLYDVVGNVISSKDLGIVSGSYSEKVDISSLSKGMYFIEIMTGGEKTVKKIIKD